MTQLTFDEEYRYKDDEDGISISVNITYGNQTVLADAKVDPGSIVCLFSHEAGVALGIPIEQGIPIRLGGLAGLLEAFGHEVTLQTGQLVFESLVYFAKYPGLPRNLLGRRGWLRNLRLGLIDYDNLLYLSGYDS
ncbi:MAG TPA: hypothetical protein PLD20_18135 [Blastocatellia bacterium]|nr:hypothetical protein [Blastocatellia bacterium]HMX29454.1 hypothetical protein [Blastocatellia bacterium]HMY74580.1 hypothetical protein [Blastocatellia bacterium]HMZ19861.1 hypothetical protein [Blastocatellia bacterium]HNG30252.1 hypothetical protein [Blastocatellia bacterium]